MKKMIVVLIISMLLTGCNNGSDKVNAESEVSELTIKLEKANEKIDELLEQEKMLKSDIETLKGEQELNKNSQDSLEEVYQNALEKVFRLQDLLDSIDYDQKLEIAKKELRYTLGITYGTRTEQRSQEIFMHSNGIIEVEDTEFVLSLKENYPESYYFTDSKEIFDEVKIDGFETDFLINNKNGEIKEDIFYKEVFFTFEDLNENDEVSFDITDELRGRLKLSTNKIVIRVKEKDKYNKVSDYTPSKNMKKIFSGGYENTGYSKTISLLDENVYRSFEENGATNEVSFYQVKEDELKLIYHNYGDDIDKNQTEFLSNTDRAVLKGSIHYGAKWSLDAIYFEVTGVNIEFKTQAGRFQVIEITLFNNGEASKQYYAKGVGIVKFESNYSTDELILIDYENE